MSNEHDDPDARDAWLREALRHAPDADAAPPPRVSETILRMGRAAVAPRVERSERTTHAAPPSSGWMDGLAALWTWLARPPVAAGFATVMVATVIGLMWWDRPIEDALPPREAPVAAAPATPTAEPTAAAAPAPEEKREATPARAATEAARKVAPVTAPATPAAPAPSPRRDMAAAKSANSGTGAPAQDEAAAQAATRLRESAERRELAAAPAVPPPVVATAPPAAAAQAMGKVADAAAPAALAGRAAAPSAPIETPGLSNLRFEIRRKPAAWSWQRDDGAARPVDDALEAWIAQADRTAHPQWQAGATGSDTATTTLRFTRDGVVRAVLRVGPSGLRLTRGGKTESAELGRGQASALLTSLNALGP